MGIKLRKEISVYREIVRTYDIDETGKAHVRFDCTFQNNGDKNFDLSVMKCSEIEENVNLVNLDITDDPKANLTTCIKNVSECYSELRFSIKKILSPHERYRIRAEYDLPNYAHRIDGTFIVSETFEKGSTSISTADEFHVIYKIPRPFKKYEIWKKLCLIATEPSTKYTEHNKEILKYDFNLKGGGKIFQVRFFYNVKSRQILIVPITFLLGFFAERLLDYILNIFS